ncbi:MAG TPA: LCP family protein, partial [Actinotalea sp.]|nr:LCP family protein [Actinotalea sp.]
AGAEVADPAPGDGPTPSAVRGARRRRRWLRGVVLGLAAVLVIGAGAAAVLALRLNSNLERIPDPFAGLTDRPAPAAQAAALGVTEADGAQIAAAGGAGAGDRAAMNVLVLSSDSRIAADDPTSWEAGAQRTDVIMLVHLPADGRSAYVMSIPRDSWVPIPGRGTAKINAAYSHGGPPLLIETIEQLTGVRIDHFAVTDFESFSAVTDALGGVELTLAQDLYGRSDMGTGGQLLVPAGTHTLTGDQALVYVRERYSLRRGDFDRVQRQQAWLRAMLQRVQERGVLDDPVGTLTLLDTVSRAVAVDDGVTLGVMRDVAERVRGLGRSDVRFLTVPVAGTGTSADGQSIVNLARPAFDRFMAAVAEDRLDAYLDQYPAGFDQLGATAP